jgi:hypothetical protein
MCINIKDIILKNVNKKSQDIFVVVNFTLNNFAKLLIKYKQFVFADYDDMPVPCAGCLSSFNTGLNENIYIFNH